MSILIIRLLYPGTTIRDVPIWNNRLLYENYLLILILVFKVYTFMLDGVHSYNTRDLLFKKIAAKNGHRYSLNNVANI